MNHVNLIGRIVKDPELRFLPGNGTAVTNITLAVDKFNKSSGQKEADFIPVTIFGKQAEATANYMAKGSLMAIGGRLQTRTYDDKDGNKRFVMEVVANETQFLSKKAEGSGTAPQQQYGSRMNYEEDMTPVDDGDIPF